MRFITTEPVITPALLVDDESTDRNNKYDTASVKSSNPKAQGEAAAQQDETCTVATDVTLSNTKLIILGTAMFCLWACNAGGILLTAFSLPVIAKEFQVSAAEVQWVAASCMIVWGCFQVIAGRLCDIYGRKRGLLVGATIWIISTTVTTFMPNLPAINVCRGFSGIGAAILLPASSGIVGALYPAGRKRTWAFVAISAGGAGGSALSELFAGLFLEYSRWTWRPMYLLNALVSLYCPIIVIWLVPNDTPHSRSKKMDWIGSLLLGSSLFLLLFGFKATQTSKRGWKTPYIPALLVMFAVLFVLFVLRQRQLLRAFKTGQDRPPPLIPASLLTKECWNLIIIYIAAFLCWAGIDTFVTPSSYLYLDVLELNKFQAGLRISLCAMSGLGASLLVAVTITRVPPRALITACCIVTITSPVLFAVRHLDWPFWYADMWSILALGWATDSIVAAGSTMISTTAPISDGSVASALLQTSCRLGYPLGLAITTLVSSAVEKRSLSQGASLRDALVNGIRATFWFIAALVASAALIVGFGMRGWTMLDGKTKFRDRRSSKRSAGYPRYRAQREAMCEHI